MKIPIIVLALSMVTLLSFSQERDTTALAGASIFSINTDSTTGQQTLLVSARPGIAQLFIRARGTISIAIDHQLSFTEELIVSLESDECEALRKRDQVSLRRLWAKNFTLDQKQTKLVTSDNPLPSYLSFERMVEKITVIDSTTALTSGYEMFQQFTTGVNTSPRAIRKFFHAWTKQNGLWKLSTRKHE